MHRCWFCPRGQSMGTKDLCWGCDRNSKHPVSCIAWFVFLFPQIVLVCTGNVTTSYFGTKLQHACQGKWADCYKACSACRHGRCASSAHTRHGYEWVPIAHFCVCLHVISLFAYFACLRARLTQEWVGLVYNLLVFCLHQTSWSCPVLSADSAPAIHIRFRNGRDELSDVSGSIVSRELPER